MIQKYIYGKPFPTEAVVEEHMTILGYEGAEYEMYEDDGVSKEYQKPKAFRKLCV